MKKLVAVFSLFILCSLMFLKQPAIQLTDVALENIEALSQNEGGTNENTSCPDFNYVPDRYLVVVGAPQTLKVTCSTNGSLTIGGMTLTGGYEKGKEYTVILQTMNCDGEQVGACCDQRKVGTNIL